MKPTAILRRMNISARSCLFLAFSLQPLAFSQAGPTNNPAPDTVGVTTDTNGNLVAPANLFSQNLPLLNAAGITASTATDTNALHTTNNLSDLANAATARANLGLGTAAASSATAFQSASSTLTNLSTNNAAALTNLYATNLVGTLQAAQFPATLPNASGANLTALPAANLSGMVAVANGGTASSTIAGAANVIGTSYAGSGFPWLPTIKTLTPSYQGQLFTWSLGNLVLPFIANGTGVGQMTNAWYLPQGLAGSGDWYQMNSNSLGNPVMILNGNPALQRASQAANDAVYIFYNANPFQSGSGICAGMITTNVAIAANTNALSTNADGIKIYPYDQFALFLYALGPEGPVNNGPNTVGLVANQHRMIFSSPATFGGVPGNYIGMEFVRFGDPSGLDGIHIPFPTAGVNDVTNSTNVDVAYFDQAHGNFTFGNVASAGTANTATFGGTNFLFIRNSKQGMKIFDGAGFEAMQAFSSDNGLVAFYDESLNNFADIGDFGIAAVSGGISTAVTSQSANYNIATSDSLVLITASGKTATLPTAVTPFITGNKGRVYTVKLTVSGSATVTTSSSQTIDGASTYSLSAQNKYVTVQSDGANWWVIANN